MTQEEFQSQVDRLIKTYGKPAYPDERIELILAEVKDFDVIWLKGIVSQLIGASRQAPLVDSFQTAAVKERERIAEIQKAEHSVAAKKFMRGNIVLPDSERAMMMSTIRARINGEVTDEQWAGFMKLLETTFGPIEPLVAHHAALEHPRENRVTVDIPPEIAAELAEKQRRSLPYIDN